MPAHGRAGDDAQVAAGDLVADPGRVDGERKVDAGVMPLAPGVPGVVDLDDGARDVQRAPVQGAVGAAGATMCGREAEDVLAILERDAAIVEAEDSDSDLLTGPRVPGRYPGPPAGPRRLGVQDVGPCGVDGGEQAGAQRLRRLLVFRLARSRPA